MAKTSFLFVVVWDKNCILWCAQCTEDVPLECVQFSCHPSWVSCGAEDVPLECVQFSSHLSWMSCGTEDVPLEFVQFSSHLSWVYCGTEVVCYIQCASFFHLLSLVWS